MEKCRRAVDEAIAWLIRQRDPALAEWGSFTAWLEADPGNAAAYAKLVARDEAVAERLMTIGVTIGQSEQGHEGTNACMGRRRLIRFLIAIAAAAATMLGAWQVVVCRRGDGNAIAQRSS